MSVAMTSSVVRDGDREAWLADRRKSVGASEAAAAMGLSFWESPRELYLRKRGLLPELTETEAMRWGSLLEPLIAAEYERRTGNRVVIQQVFLRSTETPMSATIDGITEAGYPVEFKTIGSFGAKGLGEEGSDQLPEHWLIQGHQQMLLHGSYRMDFAVLVGGQRLRIFEVERDEDLVEEVIKGVRGFWKCVEEQRAPEDLRPDPRVMHLIYPGCEGEIELDSFDESDVKLWEHMKALGRDAGTRADELRGKLLERLGNHRVGILPDGRTIEKKKVVVKPFENKGSEGMRLYLKEAKER